MQTCQDQPRFFCLVVSLDWGQDGIVMAEKAYPVEVQPDYLEKITREVRISTEAGAPEHARAGVPLTIGR